MTEPEPQNRTMLQRIRQCDAGLTPRDRRNQWRFVVILLSWALSFVIAIYLLRNDWVTSLTAGTALALIPIALGLLALLTYLKFLREADEMTRRIQLEALAIGFGAGAIYTLGYPALEAAGWPEPSDSAPAVVLMVGWGLGGLFALRRYL